MTFSPPKISLCVLVITLSVELNDIGSQRLFNEHCETYGRNYLSAEFIHAASPNPSDPTQKNLFCLFSVVFLPFKHSEGEAAYRADWLKFCLNGSFIYKCRHPKWLFASFNHPAIQSEAANEAAV